jgi:transcriptional antiterminator NusG
VEKENLNNLDEKNMDAPEEKTSRLDEFTFIKQEKTDTPKWYVVYTYSGYEDKVMNNLKKTIVNNGLEDLIYDVQVPKEETIEVRNGNRKRVQKKLYPGYVMVKMLLTDQTWYIVRNTRGVTGFVGPGSKPIPLTDVEIRTMGIEDVRISLNVSVGQEVIIVSGPFENFTGKVTEVNAEQQKVKVTIPMFGRDTQVELDFVQVKGV